MNNDHKIMWLIMVGVVVAIFVAVNVSHVGGLVLLLTICPIGMMLMMAFMMKNKNHGHDTKESRDVSINKPKGFSS